MSNKSSASAETTKRRNNSANLGVIMITLSTFLLFSLFLYKSAFNTETDRQYEDLLSTIRHIAGGNMNFGASLQSSQPLQVTDAEYQQSINQFSSLLVRTENFLSWVTNIERTTKHSGKAPPYSRWDLISNADIHIAYKLSRYLRFHLSSEEGRKKLLHILNNGYQCSHVQAAQQEFISNFIKMDICSEVEWYKLAQLAWPEAKTFFDVGANKGYLGSLFLTLWGGGGLNASPAEVFGHATKLGTWKGSRNPAGYCRDGHNFAIQSFCPDDRLRDEQSGKCMMIDMGVRVHSFDGSSYLTSVLNDIIKEQLFPSTITDFESRRQMWSYSNFAVSNVVGTTRFTKQSKEKNAGYEGGGIRPTAPESDTEEVPMTTVDTLVQQLGLGKVDLLKIDTEGNDNNVLLGAERVLKEQSGMFTFEGGLGITFSKDMIDLFDTWGYNCYSTSRAGLFKWNGNCMKEKYMGGFKAKDKGNVFCVSRKRAPMAAIAFDILSFPVTIEFNLQEAPSQEGATALTKGELQLKEFMFNQTIPKGMNSEIELHGNIHPSSLTALYVNIHGFCKPFPNCATLQS